VKADTVGLYLRQLLARPEVATTDDPDGDFRTLQSSSISPVSGFFMTISLKKICADEIRFGTASVLHHDHWSDASTSCHGYQTRRNGTDSLPRQPANGFGID
jgi:hypothetical protein